MKEPPGAVAGAGALQEQALERAERAFADLTGSGTAADRLFVPGRLEILGKHTDYAGGQSLTGAVERGFTLIFRGRDDGVLRIADGRDGRRHECRVTADADTRSGHWSNYPTTVVRRLCRNFPGLARGADIGFFSTLPKAAGLSTSSALITGVYLILVRANGLESRADYRTALARPEAVPEYLGAIENGQSFGELAGDRGVGTRGGSEDHTAILLSKPGQLGCYDYHPVTQLSAVPLDPSLTFVVAASGIAADKTGSARERYNRASTLARALVDLWRAGTGRSEGTLGAALASGEGAPADLRRLAAHATIPGITPTELVSRLDHFTIENSEILPAAIAALSAGDLGAFGALADRSQDAAERLLGNQVAETVSLARLARELGAHAASSFGAGFGGSVWALVEEAGAASFLESWSRQYADAHPAAAARAEFFVTRPGGGATAVQR